jgi:Protein of unknown function (DUF1214)
VRTDHERTAAGAPVDRWRMFGAELGDAGAVVHERADAGRTPAEQEQVTTSLLWTLLAAVASIPSRSTDFPEFTPIINPSMRRIAANVDTTYSGASIRGDGAYRITGRRGTVHIVHLQVIAGRMGSTEPLRVLADINLDECRVNDRGWVDIVLSPERPDEHDGDWFPLDPSLGDAFVTLRQISYDWINEVDAALAIERIDRPAAPAPRSVLDSLPLIAEYVRNEPVRFMEVQDDQLARLEPNELIEVGRSLPGAMSGQAYMHGLIQIDPDQAWIAEWEPPAGSPYWGVQLLDYFYNTLDVMRTQASLNGHHAATDEDGRIRIVVAGSDPGVRNWLDKGAHERVQIRMRYYAAEQPTITTKVVPLDRLRDHLPPSTSTVTLAERLESAQLQHRSDGDVRVAVQVEEGGAGVDGEELVHEAHRTLVLHQPAPAAAPALLPLEVSVQVGDVLDVVAVGRVRPLERVVVVRGRGWLLGRVEVVVEREAVEPDVRLDLLGRVEVAGAQRHIRIAGIDQRLGESGRSDPRIGLTRPGIREGRRIGQLPQVGLQQVRIHAHHSV